MADEETSGSNLGWYVFGTLTLAAAGAGGYYYFKVYKPAQQAKGELPVEPGTTKLPKPQPVPTKSGSEAKGPGVHVVPLDTTQRLVLGASADPWTLEEETLIRWWAEGSESELPQYAGNNVFTAVEEGGGALDVQLRAPGVVKVTRRFNYEPDSPVQQWVLATPGAQDKIAQASAFGVDAVVQPDGREPVAQGESTNVARHGVTLNPTERTLLVSGFPSWRGWGSELLAGLNFEAWTARQLMDRVWKQTFPELPEEISEAEGYTVNGRPYVDLVARGEDFRARLNSGAIFRPRGWSPFDTMAQVMVGGGFTPYERGPDFAAARKGAEAYFLLDYVYAVVPRRVQPGGAGQGTMVYDWYVWAPTQALLGYTTAIAKAQGVTKKADAIKAAVAAIEKHRKGNEAS